MAQFSIIPAAIRPAGPQAPVAVFLFAAKSGAWIVRDGADIKGGVFANRKVAHRFIMREFGENAQIIAANPEIGALAVAA